MLSLWVVGCADGPDERYLNAVTAAAAVRDAAKADKAKAVDDLLHFFTKDSADIFHGVHAVKTRANQYAWTDLAKLLVPGNVVDVKEDGDMRILTVENEKGKKFEVRMVQEEGLWVIDGLALDRFWRRLRKVEL